MKWLRNYKAAKLKAARLKRDTRAADMKRISKQTLKQMVRDMEVHYIRTHGVSSPRVAEIFMEKHRYEDYKR